MSDVLLYAATKENMALQKEYAEKFGNCCGLNLNFFMAPQKGGYPYQNYYNQEYDPYCPPMVKAWKCYLSPLIKEGTTGWKVCDTSGQYRCNAGCTFTVPAGVSRVQFQLWGPGGGTSQNCCCGGAPFGPSGAYTVVQMNVSAGEVYCLCAGCAYCCCGTQTTPGACGTPTWVVGPGICICADSGISCLCFWSFDVGSKYCGCSLPKVEPSVSCVPHGCSGWNFCYDSWEDETFVRHAFSRATWYVNCYDTARCSCIYGVNGLYPMMCVSTGPCQCLGGTCSVSAPVFGFEGCVCKESWRSQVTCHPHCRSAAQGYLQIPGAGGYAGRVFGGCNACGGDHGRMGMVCVSYGGF